jgi:flagellar FliL protein
MSDEEGLSLEDVGAEGEDLAPAGRKAGFLPTFLIRILKWVAIGLGFIILGVTTTVVTVRIFNQGREGEEVRGVSPEMIAKRQPLEYDDTIEDIRGVTSDDPPAIFSAKVSIGYNPEKTQVAFELAARKREIQNLILLRLSQKTLGELDPSHYRALQEELKNAINERMIEGQVQEVAFREFVVTPQ